MEQNTNKPAPAYQPQRPKVPMYLIAVVVTLSVIAAILGIFLIKELKQSNTFYEEKIYVEEQKSMLETELNGLIVEYDSLKTENDSINKMLEGEQAKIKKLLGIQASNTQKIKLYEKELETLRKVMRSYIVQIDSLNTRNRILTEENIQVRGDLRKKELDYQKLSEVKEELVSKVAIAQKLSAKDVVAVGLNDRSKEKDRISKIEKIRVCFTVRENNVAEAGKKMIYLRIIRPDNIVLSSPEAGIVVSQGQELVYSAKRELEYDNLDIPMCIYWDKTETLIAGTYTFSLYCEGHEIGSTTLDLK
ncbi:MAG: hypothetical protein JXB34_10645 [Bacteroidales bacterium]|nr:hypothetical protein [Bacteroidales bacterium]